MEAIGRCGSQVRIVGRCAKGDQRVIKGVFCHMDGLAVHACALTANGGKKLVRIGIIDHAENGLAIQHQRDGYAGCAAAAGEIAGAVHRIDNPGIGACQRFVFLFLSKKAAVWQKSKQLLLQKLLHRHVRIRYQVIMPGLFVDGRCAGIGNLFSGLADQLFHAGLYCVQINHRDASLSCVFIH